MADSTQALSDLQRRALFSGALLVAIGMFTGIWTAAALTGKIVVGIPHLALAAHLNGLIGGMLLIAAALTYPHLSYEFTQQRRLTWILGVSCWANWFVTLVASFMGVNGLDYSADPKNNAIAFLLQVLVVLPMLVGSVYWVRGFGKVRSR